MRQIAVLAGLVCANWAMALVAYRVQVTEEAPQLRIEMSFEAHRTNPAVRMPMWAPGAYVLRRSFEAVIDLEATANGRPVAVTQNNDRWEIAAPAGEKITVRYKLNSAPDATKVMHWSGPSTYLYVEGRTQEPCSLDVRVPEGWKVAIGLPDVRAGQPYRAESYDVLADNPVSVGDLLIDEYWARGARHTIAMRGPARAYVNRKALVAACKKISETQIDFFGERPPFDKYVWHFNVNDRHDGAGGLEHLTSTQISFGAGMQKGAVGVFSHEYFHLWNVKRIRSKVLGPFDYTQLPVTGALWWLEGTTDYYAHLLLARSGQHEREDFLGQLNRNVATLEGNDAYDEVSPDESSRRVRETNNNQGNSNGYRLSYYNLGFVAGFCLDVEIREKSGNRYSLDDVMRALWQLTKNNQPGFEEDEIRRQCIRFGGPTLGGFYDKLILGPGPQPVGEQLAKIGLEFRERTIIDPDLGFTWLASPAQGGLRVTQVSELGTGRVVPGDVITAMNGQSFTQGTVYDMFMAADAIIRQLPNMGQVELTVKNAAGETRKVTYNSGLRYVPRRVIVSKPGATLDQIRLRNAFFQGRTWR